MVEVQRQQVDDLYVESVRQRRQGPQRGQSLPGLDLRQVRLGQVAVPSELLLRDVRLQPQGSDSSAKLTRQARRTGLGRHASLTVGEPDGVLVSWELTSG